MVFGAFGARRSPLCDCDIYVNVHSRHTGTTVENVIALRDEARALQPERAGKGRQAAEEVVLAERRRLLRMSFVQWDCACATAAAHTHTHSRIAAVASAAEKHAAR